MNRLTVSIGLLGALTLGPTCSSLALADYNQPPGTDFLLGQSGMNMPADQPTTVNHATRVAQRQTRESNANSMAVPNPILSTGSDLKTKGLSPNAIALARQLGLVEDLQRLPKLLLKAQQGAVTDRLELEEVREHIGEVLRGGEVDVDFVLAEIYDEQGIYNELVGTYSAERDKLIALTNATSFGTNGALWAVCEALDIPTATRPRFAVSSGITGILAGIIPSIASAATLKEINGRKHSAPAAPNMLAKMFDRPTTPQNDFPVVVWDWLNSTPADNAKKKRRDLIVDRWIADSNIPAFTDRNSQSQIDTVTASTEQRKTLTLSVLSARLSMLSQLASEIAKMNRLFDELEMSLRGFKQVGTEVAQAPNEVSMDANGHIKTDLVSTAKDLRQGAFSKPVVINNLTREEF